MLRKLLVITMAIAMSLGAQAKKKDKTKTAEDIYAFTAKIETFDKENIKALRSEMKTLTRYEKERLMDMVMEEVEEIKSGQSVEETDMILIYILAVIIPPVAVGLFTDWDAKPTIINLILTFIGWLPGVIHAFIVVT
ncbi:MAG: YqaE/Pmp3 family membrane protein [Cyclobacteriaceae bacterium]